MKNRLVRADRLTEIGKTLAKVRHLQDSNGKEIKCQIKLKYFI